MDQYEKEIKPCNELVKGDVLEVAGLECVVEKVESVFHYVPDASIRVQLTTKDDTSKTKISKQVIVFFPYGRPITTILK